MNQIIGNDPTGTSKLDAAATDGLLGAEDSLAYRVNEIERHLHHYDKWFGAAAVPDAELHVADRLTLVQTSFQADGGNDDWGVWLQVLGTNDTPIQAGKVKFDFHEIIIVSHEHNTNEYDMQIVSGESAGIAAKLVSEDFTEFPIVTGAGNSETGPITFQQVRVDSGDKVWVRIRANGQNTGTLDFKIGIHEYEG